MSVTQVNRVRDAMAEIVKQNALDHIHHVVANTEAHERHCPESLAMLIVAITHVRDEALMRLRSRDRKMDEALPTGTCRPSRSKSSKI